MKRLLLRPNPSAFCEERMGVIRYKYIYLQFINIYGKRSDTGICTLKNPAGILFRCKNNGFGLTFSRKWCIMCVIHLLRELCIPKNLLMKEGVFGKI